MVDFKHRNVFLTIAMFRLNHNNVFSMITTEKKSVSEAFWKGFK